MVNLLVHHGAVRAVITSARGHRDSGGAQHAGSHFVQVKLRKMRCQVGISCGFSRVRSLRLILADEILEQTDVVATSLIGR